MSTNAYGKDFWIGQIWRMRGKSTPWRHVVVSDIRSGRIAKCHNLIASEGGSKSQQWKRGSWISLKSLAQRWAPCHVDRCWCKTTGKQTSVNEECERDDDN